MSRASAPRRRSTGSAPPLAKITPPRLPPVFERVQLFEWLDAAAQQAPLIWIEGPAGAGKTTLTTSWAHARKMRVLWYQIDAGDLDPASFFHYLGLAVSQAAPRYRMPLPKLTPEYLDGLPVFTRNFFREIVRRLKGAFVLVLDNVQDLGPEAPLYDVLREGLKELPAGSCAVLVSRSEPPPAFVRWQLSGRLNRLGWDALRLGETESVELAAFLSARIGQPVSTAQAQALHRQCNGWLAGMVLLLQGASAGIELHGELDAGAAQSLFDYFAGEIFDRRHPAVKEFLMLTALLPSAARC